MVSADAELRRAWADARPVSTTTKSSPYRLCFDTKQDLYDWIAEYVAYRLQKPPEGTAPDSTVPADPASSTAASKAASSRGGGGAGGYCLSAHYCKWEKHFEYVLYVGRHDLCSESGPDDWRVTVTVDLMQPNRAYTTCETRGLLRSRPCVVESSDQAALDRFLAAVVAYHYRPESFDRLHTLRFRMHMWVAGPAKHKRLVDTVFLPSGLQHRLVDGLRAFLGSEKCYAAIGAPYKRAYLFEGLPGTGKTSMAHVMASEINYGLAVFHCDKDSTDQDLISAVDNLPERCMLLLEDVDEVLLRDNYATQNNAKGISNNCLSNVLDGCFTPHGMVAVMTTNRPTRLDPLLLRRGRLDETVHFGAATQEQVVALVRRHFPAQCLDEGGCARRCAEIFDGRSVSMATLAAALLQHRDASDIWTTLARGLREWMREAPLFASDSESKLAGMTL